MFGRMVTMVASRLHRQEDGRGVISWPGRRAVRLALATSLVAATLVVASPVQATFGGRDGLVVFGRIEANRAQFRIALFTMNPDGTSVRRLTKPDWGFADSDPWWSPDGKKVVFERDDLAADNADLWLINADGTGLRRLTDCNADPGCGGNFTPAWTPDGHTIVFTHCCVPRNGGEFQDIWSTNVDGFDGGPHANGRALTADLVLAKFPAMTPATAQRLTADERRDAVIAAATIEFAATGYAGTSTQAIARRVGVSQPYLFQLYETKEDLFLATVRACFEETRSAFEESGRAARAAGAGSKGILAAMAHTYMGLLRGPRQAAAPAPVLRGVRRPGDPGGRPRGVDAPVRDRDVDLGRRRAQDPPVVRRGDAAQRRGVDRQPGRGDPPQARGVRAGNREDMQPTNDVRPPFWLST